jgi:hypothetical protein
MKRLVVLVFLLAALDAPLAAQDADSAKKPATPNAAPSQSGPIKVRVELVNVLFTVANKKNHLVIDLEKDDFRVLEDNKPQTIRYFSRETNLPLRIGILVDTSNSIRARLHNPAAGNGQGLRRGLRRRVATGAGLYLGRRKARQRHPRPAGRRGDGPLRCDILRVQSEDADLSPA